jgi:hypothetical protein
MLHAFDIFAARNAPAEEISSRRSFFEHLRGIFPFEGKHSKLNFGESKKKSEKNTCSSILQLMAFNSCWCSDNSSSRKK